MAAEKIWQVPVAANCKPVYLFWGDERYLLAQAVAGLEKTLAPAGDSALNLEHLDGDTVTAADVVMAAGTMSFFSDRKLIVVKNAPWFTVKRKHNEEEGGEPSVSSEVGPLLDYLADPVESTCIVFILPVGENAAKTLKTVKAVQKIGELVSFLPLKDEVLQMWLRQAFRQRQQRFSAEAGKELVARSGNDLTLLAQEVEKIATYAWGREDISVADVQAVSSTNVQATLFQLVDAVVAGNAKRSSECLEDILRKEGPYGVIPILAGRFRFMLLILDMKKRGCGMGEIMRETKQRSEWYLEKSLRQAQAIGCDQLKKALQILLQADLKSKRGIAGIEESLDLALLQICTLMK